MGLLSLIDYGGQYGNIRVVLDDGYSHRCGVGLLLWWIGRLSS